MSAKKYESDIILGEEYIDKQTGYSGVATAIFFFQHACERVQVECYDEIKKTVIETVFDAPRLTHVPSDRLARSTRPGGPARSGEGKRPGP